MILVHLILYKYYAIGSRESQLHEKGLQCLLNHNMKFKA